MSNCFHSKQNPLTGNAIHTPISFIYANSAARLAATGFIITDGYKLALDADTGNTFLLIDWVSPTWISYGGGPGSDTDAIHKNISGEISTITSKASPINNDLLLIEDSAAANIKKSITIGTIPVGGEVSGTLSNIQVSNDAITFAKLQNIVADSLIGRDTAGTGDPEVITLNSTLEFTGSGSIQRAALTGDVTATAGSNATTIADGVVTFAKFQNVSTDTLVGRDSAGSGVATEITLASTLVFTGSNSIGRATISGDIDIAAGSNTASIAAGAIINADINSSAGIALSKLQNITTDRLLGRDTATTGAIEEISVGGGIEFSGSTSIQRSAISGDVTIAAGSNSSTVTDLTITSETQGSILYFNGSNWVRLAPGTDGYVLKTHGVSANPTWEAGTSGGTPGGSDTQIQYNNSGSFGGLLNVLADDNDIMFALNASATTPAANNVKIFGGKFANRMFPGFIGENDQYNIMQPHMGQRRISTWLPPGNATTVPGVVGFSAFSTLGTPTARNVATTNILTRSKRIGYASASSIGSLSGAYQTVAQMTIGSGTATVGGFYYSIRFANGSATVMGQRTFLGLSNTTSAPTNVEPNSLTNQIGIAKSSIDQTQFYIVYGGTVAQTAIGLGSNFPANDTTSIYELILWAPATLNNTVYYEVNRFTGSGNFTTSGTLTGTAGTALPSSTTLLCSRNWTTNNATAIAVNLDIISIYVEQDF